MITFAMHAKHYKTQAKSQTLRNSKKMTASNSQEVFKISNIFLWILHDFLKSYSYIPIMCNENLRKTNK